MDFDNFPFYSEQHRRVLSFICSHDFVSRNTEKGVMERAASRKLTYDKL